MVCYRRAIELDPGDGEFHYNLGNALRRQQKPIQAAESYRRSLELQPGHANAHNNLGLALWTQGKLPEAIACYRQAMQCKPDHAGAHNNLGQVLQSLGRFVTFGCFNNPSKVNARVIGIWADILRRLPQSRLVLKYTGLDGRTMQRRFAEMFAGRGIDPVRVTLLGGSPHRELLAEYRQIDIALDPFPYSGGLTTCEALWMGVPVVTCPGETFASRQSLSHLWATGFTETIAASLDQYVDIAVRLASDLPRLAQIRSGLRQQMARSPLCDGKRFAENLQALLRDVWRRWVQSKETKDCPTSTTLSGG